MNTGSSSAAVELQSHADSDDIKMKVRPLIGRGDEYPDEEGETVSPKDAKSVYDKVLVNLINEYLTNEMNAKGFKPFNMTWLKANSTMVLTVIVVIAALATSAFTQTQLESAREDAARVEIILQQITTKETELDDKLLLLKQKEQSFTALLNGDTANNLQAISASSTQVLEDMYKQANASQQVNQDMVWQRNYSLGNISYERASSLHAIQSAHVAYFESLKRLNETASTEFHALQVASTRGLETLNHTATEFMRQEWKQLNETYALSFINLHQGFQAELKAVNKTVAEEFAVQSAVYNSRFNEFNKSVVEGLETRAAATKENLVQLNVSVVSELESRAKDAKDGFASLNVSVVSELESRAKAVKDGFVLLNVSVVSELESRAKAANDGFALLNVSVVSELESHAKAANDGFVSLNASVVSELESRAKAVKDGFVLLNVSVLSELESRAKAAKDGFALLNVSVVSELESRAKAANDGFASLNVSVVSELESRAKAVNDGFASLNVSVVSELESRALATSTGIALLNASVAADFASRVSQASQDLSDKLAVAVGNITTTFTVSDTAMRSLNASVAASMYLLHIANMAELSSTGGTLLSNMASISSSYLSQTYATSNHTTALMDKLQRDLNLTSDQWVNFAGSITSNVTALSYNTTTLAASVDSLQSSRDVSKWSWSNITPMSSATSRIYGVVIDPVDESMYMLESITSQVGNVPYGGDVDTILRKRAANGTEIWAQYAFNTSFADYANKDSLRMSADGFLYSVGHTYGSLYGYTNQGNLDHVITKHNAATGDVIWRKQYGAAGFDETNGIAMWSNATGSEHRLFICGYGSGTTNIVSSTPTTSTGVDIMVARLNPTDGSGIWVKMIGGASTDVATSCTVSAAGDLFVSAYSNDGGTWNEINLLMDSAIGVTTYIMKLDGDGNGKWIAIFDSSGDDVLYSVAYSAQIDVLVTAGYTTGGLENSNMGLEDAVVARIDPSLAGNGAIMWTRQLGGTNNDRFFAVAVYANLIYAVGMSQSPVFNGVVNPKSMTSPSPTGLFVVLSLDGTVLSSNFASPGHSTIYNVALSSPFPTQDDCIRVVIGGSTRSSLSDAEFTSSGAIEEAFVMSRKLCSGLMF